MKRVFSVIAAMSLFFGTASPIFAEAQTKPQLPPIPDFSGKWTVRLADDVLRSSSKPPDARTDFGALGQGGTIVQTEKTLSVITMANGVQTKAVFNLDGTETKNPIAFGGGNTVNRVSTAKWNGTGLVLTTTTTFNGSTTSTSQTWSLDEVGDLLVETTANVQGKPTKTVTKYQKG